MGDWVCSQVALAHAELDKEGPGKDERKGVCEESNFGWCHGTKGGHMGGKPRPLE